MSNQIQKYDNGEGGISKWLMIAAMIYAVAPDLIPGPVDDGGVILMALALVGRDEPVWGWQMSNEPTYNGKTWEEMSAWERIKAGLGTQCAIIETWIVDGTGPGVYRGDIMERWTGYEMNGVTQQANSEGGAK